MTTATVTTDRYVLFRRGDKVALVERNHDGKSITNSIEEILSEFGVGRIEYRSFSDGVWQSAEMIDGRVVFTPSPGCPDWITG